jgi:leucyl aminopeptidase
MDMLDVRVAARLPRGVAVVALPVGPADGHNDPDAVADTDVAAEGADAVRLLVDVPDGVNAEELAGFLDESEHSGKAGSTQTWIRPLQRLARLVFVGVGDGDEAAWRSAGAALARAVKKEEAVALLLPADVDTEAVRGLAEGLWLASYRFRLGSDDDRPPLRRVTLVCTADADAVNGALTRARTTVTQIRLARDLTNTPSDRKTPEWFAKQVIGAAKGVADLTVTVREPARLAAEGFGGILAVGSGSTRGPRLVELSYRPRGAKVHVVLVGKGITFDTGGICIKGRDGMKLMRKDMGGAAAVIAATLGAAGLRLPVRVTALAPLAENMVSGTAMRPGDVVRHFGGITSEVRNTDAEGRLVLGDALAYAATRLKPDYLIDLATLTGAQSVALGKRTAALFSDNDALAKDLATAAADAGEKVWRLPLPEDYVEALQGDDTDLLNATEIGAGAVTAALYLREFAGEYRDRWAHIDMSGPAWADGADGELVKGATGWGVRTLLRWLASHTA